jgi:c-di-GMP-binding flagellar brake protein YcgR
VGTKVGRIVKDFVLRSIVDARAPVDITYRAHRALCRVVDVTDDSLRLELLDGSVEGLSPGDSLRVFLHFQNNHHAFDTTFIALLQQPTGKPHILIAHPADLYKNLQRKFDRVRVPEGMELYFMLRGRRVDLGFPKARKAGPPRLPEVGRERPTLDALVKNFRDEATGLYSKNRIVMFRERQPSTPEEILTSSLGAVFWLPTVEEGIPETEPIPDIPIVTAAEMRAYEKSHGTSDLLVDAKIARFLLDKRSVGIHAQATCPILRGEYVLGCISIVNVLPRRERIEGESIQSIWQFSQVLSSALERYRYIADGASDRRRYEAPVMDMSASGLLFVHRSDELAAELTINTDFELTLVIEKRTVRVQARVRRKFVEPGRISYGVQFVDLAPADFAFLFRYLYGRLPAEEDDTKWEGGAPPPRVDLFGDQQ